jgi:hypothetical protein
MSRNVDDLISEYLKQLDESSRDFRAPIVARSSTSSPRTSRKPEFATKRSFAPCSTGSAIPPTSLPKLASASEFSRAGAAGSR